MKGLPGGIALLYEAVLPAADAGERHGRVTLKPDGNRITLTLNQKQMVFRVDR